MAGLKQHGDIFTTSIRGMIDRCNEERSTPVPVLATDPANHPGRTGIADARWIQQSKPNCRIWRFPNMGTPKSSILDWDCPHWG